MDNFVHLRLHTDFSIIDSIIKIDNLINKAIDNNMDSISITDFSNLFGMIKFYEKCCSNNIKPIIGADFIVTNKKYINNTSITLLIININGYHNLIRLISISQKNKSNTKFPYITFKDLYKYNSGLILISNYQNSFITKYLYKKNNTNFDNIENIINFYNKLFKLRFYMEINRIKLLNDDIYFNDYINLSYKYKIPIVATNNIRFIEKNDFEYHQIRISIYNNTSNKVKNKNIYTNEQYFKNSNEMYNLFKDIPESIYNAIEISKKCNLIINLKKKIVANFSKNKFSHDNLLVKITRTKFFNKIKKNKINKLKLKEYLDRLKYELDVIINMNFSCYFLIVSEFIIWSKKNNITVGPGRGSGAGSLVAYVLGITYIDPIKFDLIFERFLNPERLSMPDLDIDFCVEKRDYVINHVINRYGKKHVLQIITFGCMNAKAIIKDVGKVLGYTFNFINKISKLIPYGAGITLDYAINVNNELSNLYKNDDNIRELINISKKLEGIIKNTGKHAGGLVISKININKITPIYYNIDDNSYITNFDKNDIEKIGLIKFDFLGLKTLTIINNIINKINNNNKFKLNINNIDLCDKKSFNLLKKGYTSSIFQLESKGMRELIRNIKPNNFKDIVDLIALFRPGPLKSGMVDKYIKIKNNLKRNNYFDSEINNSNIKNILYSTYGIILYQEQIIKIVQVFANYSLAEADIFRIAIGKKNINDIKKQKDEFIKRSVNNNMSYSLSNKIFNVIEKFSGYGFNKSHSTAYALIAYQTLWLKANYIYEFILSVINNDINNKNKVNLLINELHLLNIKVECININFSNYEFIKYNNILLMGFNYIKGLSKSISDDIIETRNKYGKFKNLLDLCIKLNINKKNINKRSLELIIMYESLRSIENRSKEELIKLIDYSLNFSKQYSYYKINNQIDMFGFDSK